MSNKDKRGRLIEICSKAIGEMPFQTEDGKNFPIRGYYVCPLCMKTFNLQELSDKIGEVLTLEDVPPKSLGGSPILVTCKKCNSTCGHEIDNWLLNELELQYGDKNQRLENTDALLNSHGKKVHTKVRIDKDKTICFDIRSKTNPPNAVDEFVSSVERDGNNYSIQVKLHVKKEKRNVQAARIAVLKSAYLYAFRKLGYYYILNESLTPVREQILHPEKDILHNTYIIGDQDSMPTKAKDGVFIASVNGFEFIVVLLTFIVPSSGFKCRGVVALPYPGFKEDGLHLYHDILSYNSKVERRQFQIKGPAKATVRNGDGTIIYESDG
jgi:hypothetical protein